jgi:hypothetical protein
MPRQEPSRPGRQALALTAAIVLSGACVLATACGSPLSLTHHHPSPDHGEVVANLPIPFSLPVPGQPDVMTVAVAAGERFSIEVATSDGPIYWAQAGQPPDPALIRPVGDFNDGQCAKDLVGCRVPYFATYAAGHAGTTKLTWAYHALDCRTTPPVPAGQSCMPVVKVTFDLTISPSQ